ncbi:MAG: hypothetical protein Ct9H90mP9_2620 [Pseudomonadota bacterium]|nr:MAG: hypothetical protein Ct9H90mP9_2620 [Pseudomonadota bacterium]
MDGFPWECCLRSQLESALSLLQDRFQLQLEVGLEQEFSLYRPERPAQYQFPGSLL